MDYQELFEEYNDLVKKYCIAYIDIPVKKEDQGYVFADDLHECTYVAAGSFTSEIISDEILKGDFPFTKVDKEGYWHFELLMKYYPGDSDEPGCMELVYSEEIFVVSFEDHAKNLKELHSWDLE